MLSLVQIESSGPTSSPSTHPSTHTTQSTIHPTSLTTAHSTATSIHDMASSSSSQMQVPARPARAIQRTYPAVPLAETDDNILLESKASTKVFDATDLELSRPVTPVDDEGREEDNNSNNGHSRSNSGGLGTDGDDSDTGVEVEVLQSMFYPRKNAFRMATVALNTLNDGLNDSAAGALLPYIERHYGIGYGIVSLIFVACAMGSIIAATVVDPMKRRLGRARTMCLAQLIMALGYVPVISTVAPFPVVVVGFFVIGLGEAINVAMGNTFCVGLQQGTLSLGIMHGSYGIGGISGPLIATAIVVATGAAENPDDTSAVVFGRYYLLPFSVCILTAALSAWSFTGYEKDWGEIRETSAPSSSSSNDSAERRRRWRIGRQRQAVLDEQHDQQQQQDQPQSYPWDTKQKGTAPFSPAADIQLTDFASTSSPPLQRPRPISQPSTAASSRVGSRATSPTREMPSARPILSPIQSHPQAQTPSALAATPMHSFASSTAPLFVPADRPAVVTMAAPPRRSRRHADRARAKAEKAKNKLYDMFTAPSSRIVILGAMFLFMYQGAEVSIAGWVTSFLMADRGGKEPAVGYITAGFWTGITLGRFLLAEPAQRIGARRFVYGLILGSTIFELLVWFVPNVIGDAVAVSIVGLLLGPVYPCAAGMLMRGMSRRERVSGMSAMAAFGSAGGAAAPFITGVLAQAVGTFVLHPIVIGLFAAMTVFWYLVPDLRKPRE